MIQTYSKGKDVSVMVWACFWGDGVSRLIPMGCDFEAIKEGYSAASYISILDDELVRLYEPGHIFMHDNAPIHTAYATQRWLESH
ncbi:hypothetical protein BDV97DRAFT_324236, partial [Delphinella strobiligena]